MKTVIGCVGLFRTKFKLFVNEKTNRPSPMRPETLFFFNAMRVNLVQKTHKKYLKSASMKKYYKYRQTPPRPNPSITRPTPLNRPKNRDQSGNNE